MANIVGTCSVIDVPRAERDPVRWSRVAVASSDDRRPAPREPAPPPAPSGRFAEVARVLAQHEDGLTVAELCIMLDQRSETLQGALAEGLRAGRVRRSGSRCHTRYLLNR